MRLIDRKERLRMLRDGEGVAPERTVHYLMLLLPGLLVVGLFAGQVGLALERYTSLSDWPEALIATLLVGGLWVTLFFLNPLGLLKTIQLSESSFCHTGWWWRTSSIPYSRICALRWRAAIPFVYPGSRTLNLLYAPDDTGGNLRWINLHSSGGGWTVKFAEAVRDEIVERCGLVGLEQGDEELSETAGTFWTRPGLSRDELPPLPRWMG